MNLPARESVITGVIGLGRLGDFFRRGLGVRGYGRGDSLASVVGPTLVCVRVADLDGLLPQIPEVVRPHLVFVQNGFYDPLLQSHGIIEATKMVVYFAVSQKGAPPTDSGMSVVVGKYSEAVISALSPLGIEVSQHQQAQWRALAHEKILWLSVMGLLSELYHLSAVDLVSHRADEFVALTTELGQLCQEKLSCEFDGGIRGLKDRLLHYTASLGDYRTVVKEFDYRNGYLLRLGSTQLHQKLLRRLEKKTSRP